MKRINWGKAACAVFAGVLGLQVMGCGSSSGTENTTVTKEFVYVPEYQELDAQNGVDEVLVAGDTIYYRTGFYDETEQRYKESLAKMKIGEDTSETLPLNFGENSNIQKMQLDAEGNIYAVVSTYVYGGNKEEENLSEEESGMEGEEDSTKEDEAGTEGEEGSTKEDEAGAEEEEAVENGGSETEEGQPAEGEAAVEGQDAEEEKPQASDEELSYEIVEESGSGGAHSYYTVTSSGGTASFSSGSGNEEIPTRLLEIYKLANDGSILSQIDISEVLGGSPDVYIQDMEIDKDGNLYLGLDQDVLVIDKDGKEICKI